MFCCSKKIIIYVEEPIRNKILENKTLEELLIEDIITEMNKKLEVFIIEDVIYNIITIIEISNKRIKKKQSNKIIKLPTIQELYEEE